MISDKSLSTAQVAGYMRCTNKNAWSCTLCISQLAIVCSVDICNKQSPACEQLLLIVCVCQSKAAAGWQNPAQGAGALQDWQVARALSLPVAGQ